MSAFRLSSMPVTGWRRCLGHRRVHIAVKKTPNEESRIFCPEGLPVPSQLFSDAPLWFPSFNECSDAYPLIKKLFKVSGVAKVMVNKAQFTITKLPDVEWATLQPELILTLNRAMSNGIPVESRHEAQRKADAVSAEAAGSGLYDFQGPDRSLAGFEDEGEWKQRSFSPIEQCIHEVLEEKVLPIVEEDGGYVELKRFDPDTGVVWLILSGSCDGCPSASTTIYGHIKQLLQYFFEEVKDVQIWGQPGPSAPSHSSQ